MNLMHLRYFCKLAETENYTIASAELYISQPGLSGAISALEQELGLKLFEKSGRNIKLTKNGKEFYSYVSDSLKILDNGISIMHEHSGKLKGDIDIAAITTIHSNFLPSVINDFQKTFNNIRFHIHQGQTESIMNHLKNEVYDIGFCTYTYSIPGMKAVPVLTQDTVALVRSDHPLAGKGEVYLKDLVGYPVLTYSESQQIGTQYLEMIMNSGLGFKREDIHCDYPNELFLAGTLMQSEDSELQLKNPVGCIAMAPYLENFPGISILRIVDVPSDFRVVYMVYNEKKYLTHVTELFVNYVNDHYAII
ncbi:MAG: LysR family transcriptional regulator [Eubacterium sp.]|nr:LysR family transcriptional regulator [Eubacterium sp.]